MAKKKTSEKPGLVKPSLKKPEADPEDLTLIPVTEEEKRDVIPEEDLFETPPYEPPAGGEGP